MSISPMLALILEQLLGILDRAAEEAYFVGGCVRDLLLGRPLHDLDLVVSGDAVTLARTVARDFFGAFVLLDADNGVARVVLRGRFEEVGPTLDFARLRGQDLRADLAARDLTVNAIAMRPAAFGAAVLEGDRPPDVVDPWGGGDDLRSASLRMVGPDAFRSDPLRTLRAVRLAAELGFTLEPETVEAIREAAHLLPRVSWERVRDEITRLLACSHAAPYLPLLDELGLRPAVLPEMADLGGGPDWGHLCEMVAGLEWIAASLQRAAPTGETRPYWQPAALRFQPELTVDLPHAVEVDRYLRRQISGERTRLTLLKLAVLLQPEVRDPTLAGRAAQQAARRLRLSGKEVRSLGTAVALLAAPDRGPLTVDSRRGVYCLYRDAGEMATGVLLLALAQHLAVVGPQLDPAAWRGLVDRAGWILRLRYERSDEVISPPRLLDGNELVAEFQLTPGPIVGRLLAGLREAQAAGEVRTRDEAVEWARQGLDDQGG